MDQLERQRRIVEYLKVKPVNHGQVYTFQIAVSEADSAEISPERFELLSNSFIRQSTNLIPVIIRRTDRYSEQEEYEAVYGADWCLVAKELDIEKLWVWVFDMTDEEAILAKQEMRHLLGSEIASLSPDVMKQFETLLKRHVDNSLERILKFYSKSINETISGLNDSVNSVTRQVQVLERSFSRVSESKAYADMTVKELKAIAKERGIAGYSNKNKGELVALLTPP